MRNWFRADWRCRAIDEITPQALLARGVRFVLVDLDNTLADYDTPEPNDAHLAWFQALHDAGIRAAVVSNNKKERVETFCAPLGVPYFWKSGKPRKSALSPAMAAIGARREETALIGDKKTTDVLCARLSGVYAIRVDSIKPRSLLWKK